MRLSCEPLATRMPTAELFEGFFPFARVPIWFPWMRVLEALSRKMPACRRNSSATIGGWVEMVETTVTRTPLRWIASTSERKSPSPENSTM